MPQQDFSIPVKSPNRVSRSLSISSDKTSQTGYGAPLSPPLTVRPEAAFIAASAASQIVTNDHDSRADTWFDQNGIEPSGETALVAPAALKLINRFLDQLLFSFLAIAKSTSLNVLRPAVLEVLKTKLANAAIQGADQELHDYLGGGEDEELLSLHNTAEHIRNWDLELVWKRTRLRCMVYSSLGDMEEEDEDFYTEQEQLGANSGSQFAPGVVSPAVAIFLTSILEYTGEQVLIVAGQSAYTRLRAKLEKEEHDGTNEHGDIADRVVVEELDMERVAMDRTIGRLWRGWKKRVRTPTAPDFASRSLQRDLLSQSPTSLGPSTADGSIAEEPKEQSLATVLAEYEHAAGIPIPTAENDIREIEIPGLASQSDDEDADDESEGDDFHPSLRPRSLIFFDHHDGTPIEDSATDRPAFLSEKSRTRSHSMPSPVRARYGSRHEKITSEHVNDQAGETDLQPTSTGPNEDLTDNNEEPPKHSQDVESEASELDLPVQGTKLKDGREETGSGNGIVASTLAGAAAVGGAAVIGIAAAARGEAPQTDLADESDEDDLHEEPQIMTSSRISIGGRNSPDAVLNSSRSSIHSLRLVDVASPTRSRAGSFEAGDGSTRPNISSRPNSIHSPLSAEQIARVVTPVSRGHTASPIQRSGSGLSTRQLRNGMEPSIMEEKEITPSRNLVTPDPSEFAGAIQGVEVGSIPAENASPVEQEQSHQYAKQIPLIMSQVPSSRQARAPTSHPSEEQSYSTRPIAPPRRITNENSIHPLAPLREIQEGVVETPQEVGTGSAHSSYDNLPSAVGATSTPSPREQNPLRSHPTPTIKTSPPRASATREDGRRQGDLSLKPSRPSNASISTSSSASHKLKALRTSEDSGPSREDKGQSFEQLIRSDQTIQYTLTPQNMRNIESPDSPRHIITPTIVSNGFDNHRPTASRSRSSSNSKNFPTQSNSAIEQSRSPNHSQTPKQIQRHNSNSGARSRTNTAEPRDARVDRDSVNDFAEFIRSTGPANGYSAGPPRALLSHRGTNGTPRNASGTLPKSTDVTKLPRRAESSAGRSRLQARDAIVPRGDSISDLIDFVRAGPQLEKDNHRIPRTVAPFRSTMDSDQMVDAVAGKAVDASFPDRYSQVTAASVNSSVNSRSALLNGDQRGKSSAKKQSQEFDDEQSMPKRKTRRVRDPYAIDLSDEDEEDFESYQKPKPAPIKEESLADFLKNVPPPKESTVLPIYDVSQAKKIKKKSSSHSFRSRFSRKDSIPSLPPKPSSSYGTETRGLSSRDKPKLPNHTPIAAQFASTTTTYEPSRSGSYVSQVDNARRVTQKTYQPRDAASSSTRTNELADFLMKSDPPSQQTQPKTFQPTLHKEEGTFQRMFGRKKVH